MSTTFIIGGARSGKSRYAVATQRADGAVAFIATAEARDADMARRIARHRAERPRDWQTIEAPHDLAGALDDLKAGVDAAVIDCLTLWVANRQLRGDGDAAILDAARELAGRIRTSPIDLTLVSNEVGEGVHPPTADGMRFRDLLGTTNQLIAAACDTVVLMVAGIPVTVKPRPADVP